MFIAVVVHITSLFLLLLYVRTHVRNIQILMCLSPSFILAF